MFYPPPDLAGPLVWVHARLASTEWLPGPEPWSLYRIMAARLHRLLPWQVKIAAKLLLSRFPVGHSFWRRVGVFQHGKMNEPDYAYRIFRKHIDRVSFGRGREGFVVLEIGPGDSIASALIARAFGATRVHLVNVGDFAQRDVEVYRRMASFLRTQGLPAPAPTAMDSFCDVLALSCAEYHTDGVESLRSLPDASVDFIWSEAVLEHVRLHEFDATLRELRRVLRADGVCSHCIDLRDHLANGLSNLRFSERIWESDFFAASGFYTNRIRFSDMLSRFRKAGFGAEVIGVDRWLLLPTPKNRLAQAFQALSNEELRVAVFDVVLRPALLAQPDTSLENTDGNYRPTRN